MHKVSRRKFIGILAVGIGGSVTNLCAARRLAVTPVEIEGPFYPVMVQQDKDFDLTRVHGRKGRAKGRVIVIEGRIVDTSGRPVRNATVDLWQANAAGRYRHPHDANTAPLDSHFQGWAIIPSGKNGGFRFKTIFPGIYPAAGDWFRPPHIHFKVSKRGYVELITQMYFPGHRLNAKDLLLQRKTPAEQKQMIAKKKGANSYQYTIVMQRSN